MVTRIEKNRNKPYFSCSVNKTSRTNENQPNPLPTMWSHLHDFYLSQHLRRKGIILSMKQTKDADRRSNNCVFTVHVKYKVHIRECCGLVVGGVCIILQIERFGGSHPTGSRISR